MGKDGGRPPPLPLRHPHVLESPAHLRRVLPKRLACPSCGGWVNTVRVLLRLRYGEVRLAILVTIDQSFNLPQGDLSVHPFIIAPNQEPLAHPPVIGVGAEDSCPFLSH